MVARSACLVLLAAASLSAQNNVSNGCGIATTSNRGCVKPDGSTITVDDSGVISSVGGAGIPGGTNTAVQFNNSGAFGGDATNFNYNSASHVLSILGGLGIGATAPAVTFGTGGGVMSTEGTAPTVGFPAASVDGCYADSTSHTYKCSFNNSALFKLITDADTGTVTNTMLAGSIANAKLANSATTVNGQTCTLGSTCTVADSTKVPTTTTVNGHALSTNVVVSATDISTGTLAIAQGGTGTTLPQIFNVKGTAYGALGDAQYVTDAVLNGTTTVTSASGKFTAAINTKVVQIYGGNGAGGTLTTTATFVDANTITLGAAATYTIPAILSFAPATCATQATGYITVTAGAFASGSVVGNGTSGCTTVQCVPMIHSLAPGSGGACTATVGSGAVTAVGVTAGSGYTAVLAWGTDDSTAINSAIAAACVAGAGPTGGTVYFPQGNYLIQASDLVYAGTSCSGLRLTGAGRQTTIIGDTGNQDLLRIGTLLPYAEVDHLQFISLHAGLSDASWFGVQCLGCSHLTLHDNLFGWARCSLQVNSAASEVDAYDNTVWGGVDSAFNSGGDATHANSGVRVRRNRISGVLFAGVNSNGPHDINLEDCTPKCGASDNDITDVAETAIGTSSVQLACTHYTSAICADGVVEGNNLRIATPTTTNVITAIALSETSAKLSGFRVTRNTANGYTGGISITGLSSTVTATGTVIADNNIYNMEGAGTAPFCMYMSSSASADQGVSWVGNKCAGVIGANVASFGGVFNRVAGITFTGNSIHFMGRDGISVAGVSGSTFTGNTVCNNSQSSSGTYSGLNASTFTSNTSFNIISGNTFCDSQGSQTQKYGILLGANSTNNRVNGNAFGATGNQSGTNISDAGTGTQFDALAPFVNITPVSTVASNTGVQNLMTVALPAGALNVIGKTLHVYAPAVYTTGSGSSNGIQTWLLRLCSVSGCASGTVVNMVSIASATDVISTTNGRVDFDCTLSTISTGATGTMEPHGRLGIVLASTATTPPTWYMDSNTAASGSIDLTAAWFVQVSVTMATNGATTASSIATQRQLVAQVQ